jgi:DNA polymerase-3 subunit alpha
MGIACRLQFARRLVLRVAAGEAGNGFVPALAEALTPYQSGGCPVCIDYEGEGALARLRLGDEWRVRPEPELITRLTRLLAADRVAVDYRR